MSFILDALKKSENERQRHRGPSLIDIPFGRPAQSRPWWALALAGLLLLNLLVLAVALLHDKEPAAAAVSRSAPASAETVSEASVSARANRPRAPASAPPQHAGASDPAVRSLAEEAGIEAPMLPEGAHPALAAAAEVPAGRRLVERIQGPSVAPVRSPQPLPSRRELLPTINEITANGAADLPPLHLDIHVYATDPTERFVFINMRKYHEGDALSEGPHLERIERDGVVLNHRGLRFELPRR